MNLNIKDKRMIAIEERVITLLSGEIFEYEHNLYMKTDMENLNNDTICVNLRTGETREFGGVTVATLVVADLILYPNSCKQK